MSSLTTNDVFVHYYDKKFNDTKVTTYIIHIDKYRLILLVELIGIEMIRIEMIRIEIRE